MVYWKSLHLVTLITLSTLESTIDLYVITHLLLLPYNIFSCMLKSHKWLLFQRVNTEFSTNTCMSCCVESYTLKVFRVFILNRNKSILSICSKSLKFLVLSFNSLSVKSLLFELKIFHLPG